jgi:uncharacterized RDD family membrane protein YckC
MTDQPTGPTEPTPQGPPEPTDAPQPAPPAPPTAPGLYGAPQAPAYGAPQPPPYGAPQPPPSQYGAQPGYPPPAANPYGGYSQAPVYAGGQAAYPGSIGYVEQNFGKVASFGQRALAYLIDFAITLIGLIPMILGIILLVAAAPELQTDQFGTVTSSGDGDAGLAVTGGLLIALGVLVSIAITLWNRVFKMGRTGQSVGKKAIGLFLLDDKTGRPIGAGMCFLRELVQGLVNQIFYLGWLWMLWDTDKQTLGDKAVHSSVVVVPKG